MIGHHIAIVKMVAVSLVNMHRKMAAFLLRRYHLRNSVPI
jgi:hypothetical protein